MTNQDKPPKSSGGGNFLSGLLFGSIAGAVGYFLFGTKKGETARKKLEQEWETAKGKMVEEGVIVNDSASLGEVVKGTIQHVIETPKRQMPERKSTKKKISKK